MYEKRNKAFLAYIAGSYPDIEEGSKDWLMIREAFYAGWAARKLALYRSMMPGCPP